MRCGKVSRWVTTAWARRRCSRTSSAPKIASARRSTSGPISPLLREVPGFGSSPHRPPSESPMAQPIWFFRLKALPRANNLSVLLNHVRAFSRRTRGVTPLFRGQGDASWPLIPSVGRHRSFDLAGWKKDYDAWCQRAAELVSIPRDQWRRMALAQHHGFPTPLLDWSTNPLVACYFASAEEPKRDGVVYLLAPAFWSDRRTSRSRFEDFATVFSLGPARKPVIALEIPASKKRQRAQQGAYTFSVPVHQPLNLLEWPYSYEPTDGKGPDWEWLAAVRIPARCKPPLLWELNRCAVSRSRLFPDLDGVSAELVSQTSIPRRSA